MLICNMLQHFQFEFSFFMLAHSNFPLPKVLEKCWSKKKISLSSFVLSSHNRIEFKIHSYSIELCSLITVWTLNAIANVLLNWQNHSPIESLRSQKYKHRQIQTKTHQHCMYTVHIYNIYSIFFSFYQFR